MQGGRPAIAGHGAERPRPEPGKPRVLLTGGGTAGHVVPALAVAAEILALSPGARLLYVGTRAGVESDLVARAGLPFEAVDVRALSGRRWLDAAASLGRAALATAAAGRVVRAFRPHAALGTGGYVAGPVLLAATLLGVPGMIHEQNLRPGITNRLLGRFVRRVLVSFEESRAHFPYPSRVAFTGYPVRREILTAERPASARHFGLCPDEPTLLVVGGSRGARTINEAVKAGLPSLLRRVPRLQVLVSTGEAYYEDVRRQLERVAGPDEVRRVRIQAYIHEMHHAYASADLVLCRAGGSVHELTARGLPAVLVPSPNVAYDQQSENARQLVRAGAARLVEDRCLSGDLFADVVAELFAEPALIGRMAAASARLGCPDAARRIAELLLGSAGG